MKQLRPLQKCVCVILDLVIFKFEVSLKSVKQPIDIGIVDIGFN
jgi:hypothetical protein